MAGTMFENWPPQLVQAFIILAVGALGTLGLVVTALGLYIRNSLKTSSNKQAYELAITKTSFEFVAGEAKRLSERQDRSDETIIRLREDIARKDAQSANQQAQITDLSRQLETSRATNRERDERMGELKAKLEQAIQERAAQAQRAAEMADRITELEDTSKRRHEENTQREIRYKEMDIARLSAEKERDAALKALAAANARIVELEAEIAALKAEAEKPFSAPLLPANVSLETPKDSAA